MRDDGLIVQGETEGGGGTATCGILLGEDGELVGGVADMGIMLSLSSEEVRFFFSISLLEGVR